jgi:hypothetical protein
MSGLIGEDELEGVYCKLQPTASLQPTVLTTGRNRPQPEGATAVAGLDRFRLRLRKIQRTQRPVQVRLHPKREKRPDRTGLLNTTQEPTHADAVSFKSPVWHAAAQHLEQFRTSGLTKSHLACKQKWGRVRRTTFQMVVVCTHRHFLQYSSRHHTI